MTRLTRLCRALGVGLAVAATTLSMTGVAHAGPNPPALPKGAESLAPPVGNKVFLVGHATGVQIYTCNGTAWSSAVPRATLVGDNDKEIIQHFVGPTWQAKDGSTAKLNGTPTRFPVDGTIPWLLLPITGAPGSDGDRLAHTTFIQRVNTTGGVQPLATDCNSTTAGKVSEIPYTADYYFYKATGGA